MRLVLISLLSTVIMLSGTWGVCAQSPGDISFVTEEYPPFNMTGADGIPTGVAVDLLAEMFQSLGTPFSASDIKVYPWARSIKIALNTPDTCLFVCTRTAAREDDFAWVGPVYEAKNVAFAMKSKGLDINSVADLTGLIAGVIRDDIGDEQAQQAGIQKIDRVTSNKHNIKKLIAGRIDIWIYNEIAAKRQIKSLGFDLDQFETVYVLATDELSYAFHKDTDPKLLAQFQTALDQLKTSGAYDRIVSKYID